MLLSNYTEELFELKDVVVKKIENINNEKHFYIEMKKRPHVCPSCGVETSYVHDYRYQIIKDITIFNKYFLPKYHRFTNRLYAYIVSEFDTTHSMKSISKRCNTSQATVARIFDKINYSLSSLPEVLSIDKF